MRESSGGQTLARLRSNGQVFYGGAFTGQMLNRCSERAVHEQGRIVNPRAASKTKLADEEKAEVAASGGAKDNGVFSKS
jgi:hypothetical protein